MVKVWIAHEAGRRYLGELPDDIEIEVCPDPRTRPSDPADVEFWVPPVGGARAADLLPALTGLKVIQLLSAGADAWIGHVPADVRLCDARGVHDAPVAEWVIGAVVGSLRGFPGFARAQEREEWAADADDLASRELTGARVLIVGAGSIGRAIERHMAPFGVTVTRVARTARPAEDVHGVGELPELLPYADVVVLVVPLTEQTRGLVDAGFLAAMPDGALLVNAARGPVVDTAALVTELAGGRISAALDVTDPEPLPTGHPLWKLPNLFLTPHIGGAVRGFVPRAYGLAGDQLRRFRSGAPLLNLVVDGY
jgi:phosphoglycerate dehydrogenase-like enzyme